ncbi:MAG: hypothetical protein ISQ70_10965 [Pirellulales bacterium]|nr:hypothetical protein [Pirellulales bacterium]
MAPSQLIPPRDQAPPGIGHLSPADRVRLWAHMVDEGDRLVFEGFRRRHPGDEAAARRAAEEWLDRRAAESLAVKVRMLAGCRSAEQSHAE